MFKTLYGTEIFNPTISLSALGCNVSHHGPWGRDEADFLAGLREISDMHSLMNCDLPSPSEKNTKFIMFRHFMKASAGFLPRPFSLMAAQCGNAVHQLWRENMEVGWDLRHLAANTFSLKNISSTEHNISTRTFKPIVPKREASTPKLWQK